MKYFGSFIYKDEISHSLDFLDNDLCSICSYSVLLNGKTHGQIVPEQGFGQGDPLSPFLFIVCAETLIHTMNQAE